MAFGGRPSRNVVFGRFFFVTGDHAYRVSNGEQAKK